MSDNNGHWPEPARSAVDADAFSPSAIAAMRAAIAAGHGRMAQFDHPEFGGPGQWMRNGMLMIGDMGNDALRARVAALCERLASVQDAEAPGRASGGGSFQRQTQTAGSATHVQDSRGLASEWPIEFGEPDTSGAQNGMRYAWFADARRLIVDDQGRRAQYDTGDHRISGVSQQQGDARTLVFSSQHGPIDLRSLPAVGARDAEADSGDRPAPSTLKASASTAPVTDDPFAAIERLADLHARGIVDAAEFTAKKADLLKRI